MRPIVHHIMLCALTLLSAPPAWAQFQLPGALGGLGGAGLPSVSQASPSNTAGVLQYCIKNNYLSGGPANAAKTALLGKLPGAPQSNSGYQSGNSGLLQTGGGQSFNLGGGTPNGTDLKSQATHKVCDLVLQHAKSLL